MQQIGSLGCFFSFFLNTCLWMNVYILVQICVWTRHSFVKLFWEKKNKKRWMTGNWSLVGPWADEGTSWMDFSFLYTLIRTQSCGSTDNLCCWCILYKQWWTLKQLSLAFYFESDLVEGRRTHRVVSLASFSCRVRTERASQPPCNIPTNVISKSSLKLLISRKGY